MHQHAQSSCSSGPIDPDSDEGQHAEAAHSLFAYPLESNFSGTRYGLQPITQLQQHGVEVCAGHSGQHGGQPKGRQQWHVFLDAAKACGSSPPDLAQAPADFVVSAKAPPKHAVETGPVGDSVSTRMTWNASPLRQSVLMDTFQGLVLYGRSSSD